MKFKTNHLRWAIPGTLAMATVFVLVAWQSGPVSDSPVKVPAGDTTPTKQKKNLTRQESDRDLDLELRKLDQAQESLKAINTEEINKTLENALKNVNIEMIRAQAAQAMKNVDMEKVQREVEESMSKIDFDNIAKEVEESVKSALAHVETSVDKEEIKKALAEAREEIAAAKQEMKKELKKQDWKKEMQEAREESMKEVQIEMQKAKEEVKKAQSEMQEVKVNMKKELENAHVDIEKAKVELRAYQEMIYDMEKDGLLSTKEDYTIQYKNSELFINGKKQPQATADQYKKYFKKGNTTIEKENGKIDIEHDHKDI
jgi:hypothetical protein